MKTLVVIAALFVGGYAVATNPSIVPRAEQAAQQAAAWFEAISQHPQQPPGSSTPAVTPSAALTAPATAAAPPTAFTTTASTEAPTAPATTAPTPIFLPQTPTPATTSLFASWSAADCDWATTTMTRDLDLDAAEVTAIEKGQDTRYGTGPAAVAQYQMYVFRWGTVLGQIRGVCLQHLAPPSAAVATSIGWFDYAITLHGQDTFLHPENASWNNGWIATYQRLIALYRPLP